MSVSESEHSHICVSGRPREAAFGRMDGSILGYGSVFHTPGPAGPSTPVVHVPSVCPDSWPVQLWFCWAEFDQAASIDQENHLQTDGGLRQGRSFCTVGHSTAGRVRVWRHRGSRAHRPLPGDHRIALCVPECDVQEPR